MNMDDAEMRTWRILAALVAGLSMAALSSGCDCVAGGYGAEGELRASVSIQDPTVFLCTRPQGGTCVPGEVGEEEGGSEAGFARSFSVHQVSSNLGDQNRECNNKPFLVIRASNCEEYVEEIPRGRQGPRNRTLECRA